MQQRTCCLEEADGRKLGLGCADIGLQNAAITFGAAPQVFDCGLLLLLGWQMTSDITVTRLLGVLL